jgi:competence ComEA-like helix-hairpin-helix protein
MYGLEAETFAKIKPRLKHTNAKIKKLNINTATVDELKAHPYIKWKEANLIIQYRKQHGNYKNIKEIMKIRAFKQAFFDKVKDYLTV